MRKLKHRNEVTQSGRADFKLKWSGIRPFVQNIFTIFKFYSVLPEIILSIPLVIIDFPGGLDSKASVCNVGDPGLIPGSGRSLGEGNGNPLQYSCLENSMDWGAW